MAIVRESFLQEFNGHSNAYASYCVIGVQLDDLLRALNKINSNMLVGSGVVSEKAITFEICKESPELIADITRELHCTGFADIDAWYGEGYFVAYKDGAEYDGFTAVWDDDCPRFRDEDAEEDAEEEDALYDCFLTVTDIESGVEFSTGCGGVDSEQKAKWEAIVNSHTPITGINL